jgi:hypothetical protein
VHSFARNTRDSVRTWTQRLVAHSRAAFVWFGVRFSAWPSATALYVRVCRPGPCQSALQCHSVQGGGVDAALQGDAQSTAARRERAVRLPGLPISTRPTTHPASPDWMRRLREQIAHLRSELRQLLPDAADACDEPPIRVGVYTRPPSVRPPSTAAASALSAAAACGLPATEATPKPTAPAEGAAKPSLVGSHLEGYPSRHGVPVTRGASQLQLRPADAQHGAELTGRWSAVPPAAVGTSEAVRLLSACEPAPTRSDVAEPMHATAAESTAECIVHDPTAEMRAAAAEEAEEDARVERALDRVMLLLDRRYAVPPSPEAPPEGTPHAPRAPALRNAGKSMCCTLEHSSPCAVRLSTRVHALYAGALAYR